MSQPSKLDQRTLLGDDYISVWVEAFIRERIAQNLAKGTIQFYKDKLIPFGNFCDSQEAKFIGQITPFLIRDYLILLSEQGHNDGGVHGYYRAIKAWLLMVLG